MRRDGLAVGLAGCGELAVGARRLDTRRTLIPGLALNAFGSVVAGVESLRADRAVRCPPSVRCSARAAGFAAPDGFDEERVAVLARTARRADLRARRGPGADGAELAGGLVCAGYGSARAVIAARGAGERGGARRAGPRASRPFLGTARSGGTDCREQRAEGTEVSNRALRRAARGGQGWCTAVRSRRARSLLGARLEAERRSP